MTLREFLDAAYALLVAEYQRLGANLTDALNETAMWRDGGKEEEEAKPAYQRAPRGAEEVVAAQNDQALAMLQGMLAGATRV